METYLNLNIPVESTPSGFIASTRSVFNMFDKKNDEPFSGNEKISIERKLRHDCPFDSVHQSGSDGNLVRVKNTKIQDTRAIPLGSMIPNSTGLLNDLIGSTK